MYNIIYIVGIQYNDSQFFKVILYHCYRALAVFPALYNISL